MTCLWIILRDGFQTIGNSLPALSSPTLNAPNPTRSLFCKMLRKFFLLSRQTLSTIISNNYHVWFHLRQSPVSNSGFYLVMFLEPVYFSNYILSFLLINRIVCYYKLHRGSQLPLYFLHMLILHPPPYVCLKWLSRQISFASYQALVE